MSARPSLRISAEKVAFWPSRRVTDDTSVLTLKNLVFEPLCRWRDGRALPGLFERWEHDEHGRRWTFHIREDAVFHDGKPCDAGDIVAFIDGILQSVDTFGMKWSYARYFAEASIAPRTARIVEVANPRPFADILDIFSEFYVCRETSNGLPILGTGPYRVAALSDGAAAALVRTGSAAGPNEIRFVAIADAEARLQALAEGAVDVAMNTERADETPHTGRMRQLQAINTLSVIYYLNCGGGLFANRDARVAVNLAVDRGRLIDELYRGLGVPAAKIGRAHV